MVKGCWFYSIHIIKCYKEFVYSDFIWKLIFIGFGFASDVLKPRALLKGLWGFFSRLLEGCKEVFGERLLVLK